ncbi:thermonuclease family protein [Leucobacter sp. gxy201]|uniref:thermonuclease family protein n=1 Tax=Leucobacter sp. gxy201 TaxID=2957200 RepID=UPI003DA05CC2
MPKLRYAVAGISLFVCGAVLLSMQDFSESQPEQQPLARTGAAVVSRVIDGDTFDIDAAGDELRVRIIGIDTPELGRHGSIDDCYALDARALLEHYIDGRTVILSSDSTQGDTDRYGRLLRHVMVDGHDIAVQLLTEGAGREYLYDRDYVGRTDHMRAEATARSAKAGLWSQCQ